MNLLLLQLRNQTTFSRKTVCFGIYIIKTCVPDVFSESPLNTDTRIIRTLWHAPLVSVLTGFHSITIEMIHILRVQSIQKVTHIQFFFTVDSEPSFPKRSLCKSQFLGQPFNFILQTTYITFPLALLVPLFTKLMLQVSDLRFHSSCAQVLDLLLKDILVLF